MSGGNSTNDGALTVQIMDSSCAARENEFYHCSAEWHLARLSPICALIYPQMLRVSSAKKIPKGDFPSNLFFGSAHSLAEFFGYSESQVRKGFKELEELGFILLVNAGKFEPNVYRAIKHHEWAEAHKGQCTSKVVYPWTGEGDTLGQALWIESGAKVKFHPNQITGIRGLGFSEEQIVSAFAAFLSDLPKSQMKRRIPQRFYSHLAKMRGARNQIRIPAVA